MIADPGGEGFEGRTGRIAAVWALGSTAVALIVLAVVTTWWAWRPVAPPSPIGTGLDPTPAHPGELVRVLGNPGWEDLGPEEKRRARLPLAEDAERWLREYRAEVREIAVAFDISSVALGGIVAAEKTLLVDRADALAERLFATILGSLLERDLNRWVGDQEERLRRAPVGEAAIGGRLIRNPYLWTVGPAQVSFRLAIRTEPRAARRLGRRPLGPKGVMREVTSPRGNLAYAGALLAEAESAYRRIAGLEIGENPGVMATLYHLGSPTFRARRLAAENDLRASRGFPPRLPQVNYYGAFVNLHAREIAALLNP